MIYHVHFEGLRNNYTLGHYHYNVPIEHKKMHTKNVRDLFGGAVSRNVKDTFVFIIIPEQEEAFNNWVNKHGLNVVFKSKPIQNGNYLDQDPKLNIRVIKHKDIK